MSDATTCTKKCGKQQKEKHWSVAGRQPTRPIGIYAVAVTKAATIIGLEGRRLDTFYSDRT